MRLFLPLVFFSILQSSSACGGDGERACCLPNDACDSGLNKVSVCKEELGEARCQCGTYGSVTKVCHQPPTIDEARRMRQQHYIDYDAPLYEATFIGTHNSYNNKQDGYPYPNNNVNMITQLEMGLRALSLDLHDKDDITIPILCHDGVGGGVFCSDTDSTLRSKLVQINTWLTNHPEEVVVIVIEDQMTFAETRRRAALLIRNILGSKVFTPLMYPGLSDSGCHLLPIADPKVTKRKLIEQRRQVIFTTTAGGDICDEYWRKFVWNVEIDAFVGGNDMETQQGFKMATDRWTIVYEDRLFGEPKAQAGLGDSLLSRADAKAVLEKGVNLVGLDFPSTVNRHKTLIWSWATNEPSGHCRQNCCAIQEQNGSWKAEDCSKTYRFACQTTNGLWRITAAAGSFNDGPKTCMEEGLGNFDVPVNGYYNHQIARKNKIGDDIWLAYKKVGETIWKKQTAPICQISAPASAECGLPVTLDGSGSTDPDGDELFYSWSVQGGICGLKTIFDETDTASVEVTFEELCQASCTIKLVVSDGLVSSSCSTTISTRDTREPTITSPASDMEVESDGRGNLEELHSWLESAGGAYVTDLCFPGQQWTNNFNGLSEQCGSTGSKTVTFTVEDGCFLTSTTSATFTVVDTVPPSIDIPPSDLTVESDGLGNSDDFAAWLEFHGGAVASDAGGEVSWSHSSEPLSNGCGATASYNVTFTAVDECGHESKTYAIFTIVDTTPPSLESLPSDLTVEIDVLIESDVLEDWLGYQGGAVASDAGGTIFWSHSFESLSQGCGATGSYNVTFTAADECGLSSSASAVFTIVDTVPPSFETFPSDLTVESDGLGNADDLRDWLGSHGGANASDANGTVSWRNDFSGLSDLCGDTGSATVTFTAKDECGLESTASATFTIEDKTSPSIELIKVTTNPFSVNEVITVQAEFVDEAGAPYKATWDWGDGSVSAPDLLTDPVVLEAGVVSANGDIFGSHKYKTAGIYDIGLSVQDDCGNSASHVSGSRVIVYDETARVDGSGFVSTGDAKNDKAQYEFHLSYQDGADSPTGSFLFQDSVSGTSVVSLGDFDWLVAVGSVGSFQGKGTSEDGSIDVVYRVWFADNGNGGKNSGDTFQILVTSTEDSTVLFDNSGEVLVQGGNINVDYEN